MKKQSIRSSRIEWAIPFVQDGG